VRKADLVCPSAARRRSFQWVTAYHAAPMENILPSNLSGRPNACGTAQSRITRRTGAEMPTRGEDKNRVENSAALPSRILRPAAAIEQMGDARLTV